MADVPAAFLEGTSVKSTANVPLFFMTQDDLAAALEAVLFRALYSETVNGQLLGSLSVGRDDVQEVTPLASAERTATATSADFVNHGAKGLMLSVDVTVDGAAAAITLTVQYKEPVGGNYEVLFTAAAAIDAVGTTTYILYVGDIAAAHDIVEVEKVPLPRTWRVVVTHADADAITYSVSGSYLI